MVVTPFVPFKELFLLTQRQLTVLILIGIFSTGFAYYCWHQASKHLEVIPLALNIMYIGIITVISESIILDLQLNWKILIGAALMIYASVHAEIVNSKAEKSDQLSSSL